MYRIWIRYYLNDELVSTSVSAKSYERKANAEKAAQKLYVDRIRESDGTKIHYEWIVAEEDPFSVEDDRRGNVHIGAQLPAQKCHLRFQLLILIVAAGYTGRVDADHVRCKDQQ